MKTKRISYIDMAKGISILLVVLGHLEFTPEPLLHWIMSFHMPLFFILSGMMLSHTKAEHKDLKIYLQKKTRTILIPYFIFSFLSIFFSGILETATFGSYLPNALLQTFSFYGISVLWFLPALFFGEAIFLYIRKHTSRLISVLCYLALALITVFSTNTYHHHYVTDFNNYLSLLGAYLISVLVHIGAAVTFLAMGYYTQSFFFKKKHSKLVYLAVSAFCFFINLFFASKNGTVNLNYLLFNNYLYYFLAAFSGSMFIICLCAALPELKPLLYIGKNSLIIMVTHMNCRFIGICYAVGNFLLSRFPAIGTVGYQLSVLLGVTILELFAIYVINHYLPFLIGRKKHNYSVLS